MTETADSRPVAVDANNMYLGGAASDRDWKDAAEGRADRIGRTFGLPRRFGSFKLDESLRDARPADWPAVDPDSTKNELEHAVARVGEAAGWFHSVDLPHGVTTPGSRGWEHRSRIFSIPERVVRKRVLDLGAMEGGDTFNAERAGAASVTACDVDHYFQYDLGRNAAFDFVVERYEEAKAAGPDAEWAFLNSKRLGFDLCRDALGSRADRLTASVYDLDPGVHGEFDFTFCFGLLYHLRHPMLAIDRVASVTRETMLVNNQIHAGPVSHPEAVMFHADTWRGSHTNWFVPTPDAFIGMLSSSGFREIEVLYEDERTLCAACHK